MEQVRRERWILSLIAAILIVVSALVGSSWGVRKIHSRFTHEMAQRLDLEALMAERDQERERLVKQLKESRAAIDQLKGQVQKQSEMLQQERKNRMVQEQVLKETRGKMKSSGLE
jgi:chromosome segregation ATPase